MSLENSYLEVAQDYAEGVRVLFAPTGKSTGERGGVGPGSAQDLMAQADHLLEVSAKLTEAAEKQLGADNDAAAVTKASTQLLAKALTDMTVGAHLLQVAVDEEDKISSTRGRASERSVSADGSLEELLEIVVDGRQPTGLSRERGVDAPKDLESARIVLSGTIEDTLALISERTAKTGQSAVVGLFGIGLGQVGQAAGLLGQNLAQALGQADKLSHLYGLVRDFAVRAYESVLALLGPTVAKVAGQQVMNWLAEVQEARFFGSLLEKMYRTKATGEVLLEVVKDSGAGREKFISAIGDLEKLNQECSAQLALVDKLLKGLKYLSAIPVAVMPYGSLLMATIYVAICGYVVFNGADYVDADGLRLLKRVPGVRRVVEANLAIA